LAKIIQFNWRRHWKKRVEPYLQHPVVQGSLDWGMRVWDPNWTSGDAPFLLGEAPPWRTRVVPGKLSWYRAYGRCHYIAFFSAAIGVLNYPDLDWSFASGDHHTVPVGCGPDGEPRVVMDLIAFDTAPAEYSLTYSLKRSGPVPKDWAWMFKYFVNEVVPALRASIPAKGVRVPTRSRSRGRRRRAGRASRPAS
jgi:hypothetical protein